MSRIKSLFLTKNCKYCNKEFQVSSKNKRLMKKTFCSRFCQSKGCNRSDIKKITQCIICKNDFKHYGERILCGKKCQSAYLSQIRVGENNPFWKGSKKFILQRCKECNAEFSYEKGGNHREKQFCSHECWNKFQLGKNKALDGPTFYEKIYSQDFIKIKPIIKERDNFRCCLCGLSQNDKIKLHIHHIDYDKNNNTEDNLITLCQTCHMLTNFERTFWENVFSSLLSGSKIVQKGWGFESHITNNNKYCLKYLVFFKDKKFSFHFHSIKKELWHCLLGKFECTLQKEDGKIEKFIFQKGDKIEVEPFVKHQLLAFKNSIIVEVSSESYPEDSHRIVKR